MGRLADRRKWNAWYSYCVSATWAFNAQRVGEDISFTSETCQRVWYHLGLCQPETDWWYLRSVANFGGLVHPEGRLDTTRCPLFLLWGITDSHGPPGNPQSVGFFWAMDHNLPTARLVELLGTGNEPMAYHVGADRGLEVYGHLRERTKSGEKFDSSSDFDDLRFLSPELRTDLNALSLSGNDESLVIRHALGESPTPFEYLWQYDSQNFNLLQADDGEPSGPEDGTDPPVTQSNPVDDGLADSLVVELERLKRLVDEGFLTEEQAEQAKRRLLEN